MPASFHRPRLLPIGGLVSDEAFARYLEGSIRSISQYYTTVSIKTDLVPVSKVRPISRGVEKRRYKRAKKLVGMMRRRRLPLFEPCLLRYRGENGFRLVLPPVVERTEHAYVVVDGVHRLTAVSRRLFHPREVSVVVIEGESLPGPAAKPGDLGDIQMWRQDPKPAKKFRKLRPRLFRPVGATLRSDAFHFSSVEQFVEECAAASARAE